MKFMQLFPFLSLFLMLLLVSGCQSVDKPKGTLKDQMTFTFMDSRNVNDERFSTPTNERDQVIQGAIRETLEANGLTYSAEDPELVIGYLVIRMDDVSTTVIPTYYGSDYLKIKSLAHKKGVLKNRNAGTFEVGAIVIDVIDVEEGKLIYRNSARRDIMGVEDMAAMQPLVESAVDEALAEFFE